MGNTAFDKVMANRKDLVDNILENMKKGYVIQPDLWNRNLGRPHNPVSGAVYQGVNEIRLFLTGFMKGYQDTRWMTFKHAEKIGAKVKPGEKGTFCEKWIFDKKVKEVDELTGEEVIKTVRLEKPIPNFFYVFNAEQLDGIEPQEVKHLSESETLAKADDFILSSECPIVESSQETRSYYRPSCDEIHVPTRHYFKDDVSFFDVVLHEMAHSTGHETRLARDLTHPFGSEEYAKEELRAEFASYFTGADLQIPLNQEHFQDHTNYLISWAKIIENEPKELFRAIADADAATERLMQNYEKCIRIKESINIDEIPTKAMQRMRAEQLTDNQIKNIIEKANITPHHKQMLQTEFERTKPLAATAATLNKVR